MQSSFLSFLSTWPIQFHLLLRISSLIFFTPVTCEIVSFRMRCGHQILRIRLRHVNWNLSSFFSSATVSFHASHPYNKTGRTKVQNSLIFVFRPMLRVFQIFFKLKNALRDKNALAKLRGNKIHCFSGGQSLKVLLYPPTQKQRKRCRKHLPDADWLTILPRFQGARSDHVRLPVI